MVIPKADATSPSDGYRRAGLHRSNSSPKTYENGLYRPVFSLSNSSSNIFGSGNSNSKLKQQQSQNNKLNSTSLSIKRDDRIPKMSKGSRRLNGYDLLPKRHALNKSKSSIKRSNTNNLDDGNLDDDDNEGYEIIYDSKEDEQNKFNSLSNTLSTANSDSNHSNQNSNHSANNLTGTL